MDEKVKSVLKDEELKEAIKTANNLVKLKLYDIEYINNLGNKYKLTRGDKYVEVVLDVLLACIRIEDNKIVFLKKNTGKTANENKYVVYIPLDLPKDEINVLIEEDKNRKSNAFSVILKNVATVFYVVAIIFGVVGLSLAFEEGGVVFLSAIVGTLGIIFMGMILHALSFLLINTARVSEKNKI